MRLISASTLTDSGPLPGIHVQIPILVNDLHPSRQGEKFGVLDVLCKHVVKVFPVDALELVFGGEAEGGRSAGGTADTDADVRGKSFPVYDILLALVYGVEQRKLVRMTKWPFMFSLGKLHSKVIVLDHQFL
jgi:hypothetical protein